MNIVDSCGWLEYFADGPNADFFAPSIEDLEHLLVPALNVYEVFKRILQQASEGDALQAIAVMTQAPVVDLDTSLALSAAKLSTELKLPMADSVILATAKAHEAILWTQDEHFKGLPSVRYVQRK